MDYYSRNFKKLDIPIDKLDVFREGGTAKVYRYNDIVYKEYFPHTHINCTLKPEIYDILNRINNKNMMKIYDIYSDKNLLKLCIDSFLRKSFQIKAYTAKYYETDMTNILLKSIDYFLDNCSRLDKLTQIMADNHVVMYDLKGANSILTTDDIIIIDPDYFTLTNGYNEITLLNNKEAVLNLLHDIFAHSITEFLPEADLLQRFENYRIACSHLNDFFEIQLTYDTDIAYELSKKLSHVKKPIDYFADKI